MNLFTCGMLLTDVFHAEHNFLVLSLAHPNVYESYYWHLIWNINVVGIKSVFGQF